MSNNNSGEGQASTGVSTNQLKNMSRIQERFDIDITDEVFEKAMRGMEHSNVADNKSKSRSIGSKSTKHGCGVCSCMTIELTQLFFQFTFGVGAIVAFTALMFNWDSLNTTPTALTQGVHIKGKVVRAFVAVAIVINFLRMVQDYRRSSLRFIKLWYRKLTHVAAMVGIGAIALHDRQLGVTFDAISSSTKLNGYSPAFYKNVLLAIGALYGLAILFYLLRSAEKKKRSCCGICDI